MLERNKEVVGFRCECGYEFQQKRLITQRVSKALISRKYIVTAHSPKNSRREVEEKL